VVKEGQGKSILSQVSRQVQGP